MIGAITAGMINYEWQNLKHQGAVDIHVRDGILEIHMRNMDGVEDTLIDEDFSKEYRQVYKKVNGVKVFALIKKEVA